MKIGILLAAILVLVGATGFLIYNSATKNATSPAKIINNPFSTSESKALQDAPLQTVIAQNLDTPWGIAVLPDNSLLVTERKGTVRRIDFSGTLQEKPVATITNVKEIGEGGLLGIALDPEFETNKHVYLYYTYAIEGNNTKNKVVRMNYQNNKLTNELTILDNIPGASNHNGGRIKFGPDGYLYITTGDAQEPSEAQNKNSLAGKILRITKDGKAAPENPFDNEVYSYGHRNPQGIAWDSNGNLWETEHGRSGLQSGLDEINKIEAGKNYGWPEIEGDETAPGMVTPNLNSSASVTWAPGGTAIIDNTLFLTGLRGQGLYSVDLTQSPLKTIEHFKGELGRVREVIAAPNGLLYITTSNKDGRGTPLSEDDKVILINPAKL